MQRRQLFSALAPLATALAAGVDPAAAAPPSGRQSDRDYMADLAWRIAQPVLEPMSQGRLRQAMQIEVSPTWDGRDPAVGYMEAFARLLAGIAPWLALPPDDSAEGQRRRKLQQWALAAIAHAVDPASPDYLLWRKEHQPLVDAAYLSAALLRAPKALWEPLDAKTQARVIDEITRMRRVNPPYTNWLLFPAINEAFLLSVGQPHDPMRIATVIHEVNEWYVGDGWIRDGEKFHMDYYNAFVFHPFLLEVLQVLAGTGEIFGAAESKRLYDQALKRAQRYSEYLERVVSPTGSFPPLGRSMTYRTAAFQPLSMLAWQKKLPATLTEAQVRGALTAVHHAVFDNPSNFDSRGFLRLGFAGYRPEIADWYSNNGSMYITSAGFLHLGLPASDSFWTAAPVAWTAKRAFANERFERDYYANY
jgi:hypothetical protein